jgi:hypothetical protein
MGISQYLESQPELFKLLAPLQESFSKNPLEPSLTAFALKQKSVEEEDYLVWAQRTYGLPILKTDYFQLHSPDNDFWTRWKDLYRWTADCIPVAEWDGIVFVGCLERPSDFNSEMPVCFVLCSYVQLEMWHNRYHSPSIPAAPPAMTPDDLLLARVTTPTPPATAASPASAAVPPRPAKIEGLQLKDEVTPLPIEISQNADSVETAAEGELLSGFENLAATPTESILTSTTTTPPRLERTSTDVLVINRDTKTGAAKAAVKSTTPNKVAELKSPKTGIDSQNLGATVRTEITASKPTAADKVSPSTNHKAIPLTSNPIVITPPGMFYLSKVCDIHKKLIPQFRVICEPLKSHFEKYILFSVDEGEVQARPLFWSSEFGKGVPDFAVSLKVPSFFYIVASTYRPFHGPVTPNDINEKFFDEWNQGFIPDHATLIPILHKDRLIGILMGIAPGSAYTSQVLRQAAKAALEITQKIIDQEKVIAA